MPATAQATAAEPQRVPVAADGGGSFPSAPKHKVPATAMTDEDRELEEMMKMAGQA